MTWKDLADMIFPDTVHDVAYYQALYPSRNLPKDAIVTRYAPSPTGFIHMGALLASFVESSFARQTGGVFYLRIEDTDTKRTVENGIQLIIDDLKVFGVEFDEGPMDEVSEEGAYGPYIQTKRGKIYDAFIRKLLCEGKAYPCFCTEEDVDRLREAQEAEKVDIGYRGQWARCRALTPDEAAEKIRAGVPYIIRLRTEKSGDGRIEVNDLIKGHVNFPQNNIDVVIRKSDGFPTYHLAHVVDDTLMHTTHVIRADEWLSSVPLHLQLCDMLGLKRLTYAHIAPLLKRDGNSIRKLSKRKDPECAISYYHGIGMPSEAILLYLATIANSNFEDWLSLPIEQRSERFIFSFSKIAKTGAIFDMNKLMNIARNYISEQAPDVLYRNALPHLLKFDPTFYACFTRDAAYSMRALSIDRDKPNPRKDVALYSQIRSQIWYLYDELFNAPWTDTKTVDIALAKRYLTFVFRQEARDCWYDRIKRLAVENGYAQSVRAYKATPDMYKGHVGTICEMLRYVLTGQRQSLDLYSVMMMLDKERMIKRLDAYEEFIKKEGKEYDAS